MKIYNKIVIDINTNEVLEEDAFEYDGPLALCDGGGSGGDGGDGDGDGEGGDSGEGGGSVGGEGAVSGGEGAGMGGLGGAIGGDTGDTGDSGDSGDSGLGDAVAAGVAAGADVGMGVDAAMADAEAAAQSNVDAEMNSMSPETSVSVGLPSATAVVGAIASALSGNPVAGLAGLAASIANNSSVESTDPSQATAIGNLAAHGMAVPAGFGSESTGLGGFGSSISSDYGGDANEGPGDTTPVQNAEPDNTPKAPEENPPVDTGTGGTGEGTNPGEVEQNLLEQRRRRNAVGWLDMLHEGEGENPVYTPTAFEPGDKQEAVEKTTQLPSWIDTDEEKEKFYGGLFTTYGI